MSAIAGMVGNIVDGTAGERMLLTMVRRGPDEKGAYFGKGCCLLHTRLSIVDAEGGKQPMQFAWAGNQYTLVYNGELYNTEEIRKQLQSMGHTFEGHSDTEVVLHAYAQWKEECLEKFNGFFAFAIWEENNRRLFVARDRIGVKPLFYKLHEGGFLFGSEIKTILAYPTVKAELDEEGVAETERGAAGGVWMSRQRGLHFGWKPRYNGENNEEEGYPWETRGTILKRSQSTAIWL